MRTGESPLHPERQGKHDFFANRERPGYRKVHPASRTDRQHTFRGDTCHAEEAVRARGRVAAGGERLVQITHDIEYAINADKDVLAGQWLAVRTRETERESAARRGE